MQMKGQGLLVSFCDRQMCENHTFLKESEFAIRFATRFAISLPIGLPLGGLHGHGTGKGSAIGRSWAALRRGASFKTFEAEGCSGVRLKMFYARCS